MARSASPPSGFSTARRRFWPIARGGKSSSPASPRGTRPNSAALIFPFQMVRRSGGTRAIPGDRPFCRIDRRGGRRRARRGRGGAAGGEILVTANKALLAAHGMRLARLAEENGVALSFEASVAGGIPIVKTLREGLAGNSIERVYGILNGTCNYILSRMETEGSSFAECLAEAQKLGYAEADPAFDIGGFDTAHKLAILTSLAFGTVSTRIPSPSRASNRSPSPISRPRLSLATASSCSASPAARRTGSSSACIRPWRRNPPPSRR